MNLSKEQQVQNLATVFVIFGATGDLSTKKLLPSLYELFRHNLLPNKFKIIASARSPHTIKSFTKLLEDSTSKKDQKSWRQFVSIITYLSCDVAEDRNLDTLKATIESLEKEAEACLRRIFHLAISPEIYEKALQNLGTSRLNLGCQTHGKRASIVIEKPFGRNLKSAKKLAATLSKYFPKEQIYRIDHYLGKETVQNIFAFRFANELFEPVWNNKFIDHVQITQAEYRGIEKRGEFYDKTGALRDITQNHLLSLMTLVTMEEPQKFEAESVLGEKLKIIKAIKKLRPDEVGKSTVRGQYEGYLSEEKINQNSQTETYALTRLEIQNSRWQGVPFYLRTGKRLTGNVTSIIVEFKEKGHKIFEDFWEAPLPNHITLQIQPNEGIGIRLAAKKPGLSTALEPVDMEFCYKTAFDVPQPDAYERLIIDLISQDQSLFLSQDIVEESWKIIDPIRQVWDSGKPPLATYKPGTWGPEEAEKLIESDHHHWLQPFLTICKI